MTCKSFFIITDFIKFYFILSFSYPAPRDSIKVRYIRVLRLIDVLAATGVSLVFFNHTIKV